MFIKFPVNFDRKITELEWRIIVALTRGLFWWLVPREANKHHATLKWLHKQFAITVHTILHFMKMKKKSYSMHRPPPPPPHRLQWWRHNWIENALQLWCRHVKIDMNSHACHVIDICALNKNMRMDVYVIRYWKPQNILYAHPRIGHMTINSLLKLI